MGRAQSSIVGLVEEDLFSVSGLEIVELSVLVVCAWAANPRGDEGGKFRKSSILS
jgi:hypothetical protein